MIERGYNNQILKKINKSIDGLLPVGSLIALVGVLNVYITGRSVFLAIYDVMLALSLVFLYTFRKRMAPEYKIAVIAGLLLILGFLSMGLTGIISIGPQLLVLSSVLVVGFFPNRVSALYSVIKSIFLVAFVGLIQFGWLGVDGSYASESRDPKNWYMVIVLITLIDWVLIFVVLAIKNYLIAMIKTSDIHVNKIYQLAFYDAISKLPNKSKLIDAYQNKPLNQGFVIQFSIDGLSMMNTVYGTKKTDDFIKHLADVLRQHAQSDNQIARLSGNEFLWIMEDTSETQCLATYKSLVRLLNEYEKAQHGRPIIQFNGGYLEVKEETTALGTILEKTTIALEQGKLQNQLDPWPYNQESERHFLEQEALKNALIKGIREKVFQLHYQEKVDTHTGETVGVEALARWNTGSDGYISPCVFVPLLKTINATLEFDLMITEQVFKEYPKLLDKYHQALTVSINISPTSIITQSFIDQVIELSYQYKITPQRVYLELTEDAFFENLEEANLGIEQLRARGFKISIDDFGSGYTALSYIFKLKFDELKMDRSFINQLSKSPVNSAILKTLVDLSDTYHFSLVAEGVETQSECTLLQLMGCWQIQGFLFSRPCPCEDKAVKDEN